MTDTSKFYRERAKRIAAAYISSMMGTAFATEYKRIGDGRIGDSWYHIAECIEVLIEADVEAKLKAAKEAISKVIH